MEKPKSRIRQFLLCSVYSIVLFLINTALIAAELRAIAVLPANTFVAGPASGHLIEPANGVIPPFQTQPAQGFSDLLFHQQQWLAIGDNGYGSKQNSADFLLTVYKLSPAWKSSRGGSGVLAASVHFVLSDPLNKVPFTITAQLEYYPGTEIKVDQSIRQKRLLTGADFDIESFRIATDGSYWFGDEFGPFLIHTNNKGELLEAPIELPGLWSPNNPLRDADTSIVQASGGFESLALSSDGRGLIALLEKPLKTATSAVLNAYRFDLHLGEFTGMAWQYNLHADQHRIGAIGETSNGDFVIVERDRMEGTAAIFKKVFRFNPGTGKAYEIADLLMLEDPQNLAGMGALFRYPFGTIESIVMPDANTLLILNDNNYPFSVGRHLQASQPDDSELIVIHIP